MSEASKGNGKSLELDSAELRRRLSPLAPRARLDALLDAPDASELVQSIPAEDLYFDIAEVGLADATDVVRLTSPAQFRSFVDLGAWRRDRADLHQLTTWLRAARGDDQEEFLAKVHGLDLELLEILLRGSTVIHDREENPDVHPKGATLETPEGKYLIEFTVEGPELSALRALVSDLIAADPFQTTRLLEALRWEIPSELEETAYRFRTARLADLGFPPPEEAASLFAFVDPGGASAAPRAVERSELTVAGRVDFLEAGAKELTALERARLEEQLRYVANSALVAEGAEPGDPEAVRSITEATRDYLSLGIEHLSGADLARAVAVLREHHPRRIFQIGFSLTLRLKFEADRLAKKPLARFGDAYLALPEEASVLEALRRRRPLRALRLEGAEPVTFRSLRELEQTQQALERAAAQADILGNLLGSTAEAARKALERFGVPLRELGVDRLFNAVVANAILHGEQRLNPVSRHLLPLLCERLVEGDPAAPRLRSSAVEQAFGTLAGQLEPNLRAELGRMVDQSLKILLSDLGPACLAGRGIPREALANLPTTDASAL
ncbi:MAG TPA: DUF6178 family protein [Myxococcaceae bacterium]|nr:DUF6178 family protein [Myxococcaceae bacterium]